MRRSRELGFSLDEIRSLLQLSADRERPCAEVDAVASRDLDEIAELLGNFGAMRAALVDLVDRCRSTTIVACHVIDALQREEDSLTWSYTGTTGASLTPSLATRGRGRACHDIVAHPSAAASWFSYALAGPPAAVPERRKRRMFFRRVPASPSGVACSRSNSSMLSTSHLVGASSGELRTSAAVGRWTSGRGGCHEAGAA